MGCCLVQLDEPLLLTEVVLAVVTSELSASVGVLESSGVGVAVVQGQCWSGCL